MIKPEIIMPQIRDELPPRFLQTAIARAGLMPSIERQIYPSHARVGYGGNDHFGVVGTSVANNQQLKVIHGLAKHAVDGIGEHRAPVVRRNDHSH
jgi:hypothetical protein